MSYGSTATSDPVRYFMLIKVHLLQDDYDVIINFSHLGKVLLALLWLVALRRRHPLFFGDICCCGTLWPYLPFPKKVEKYQGHQRSVGWYVGEGFVAHLSYLKISQGYYSNAKRRCTTAVAEGTGSLILFASGKNWSGSTWFHKKWGSCWYWHWAFFTWGYSKHGIFTKKQGRNYFGVALDDFQKRVSTIADMKKPPQAYHI